VQSKPPEAVKPDASEPASPPDQSTVDQNQSPVVENAPEPEKSRFADRVDASLDYKIDEEDREMIDPTGYADSTMGENTKVEEWKV
jgi:hypothetical protein